MDQEGITGQLYPKSGGVLHVWTKGDEIHTGGKGLGQEVRQRRRRRESFTVKAPFLSPPLCLPIPLELYKRIRPVTVSDSSD